MKVILMSIKPEWLAKILNGEKTAELRKRFPIDYRGWVYMYCTKAIKGKPTLIRSAFNHSYRLDTCYFDGFEINLAGKVVCRFWVDNVDKFVYHDDGYSEPMFRQENGDSVVFDDYKPTSMELKSCVEMEDWVTYSHNKKFGNESKYNPIFAIHISKLEIFDKPKEVKSFMGIRISGKKFEVEAQWHLTRAPRLWQYIYIKEEK